MQNTILSARRYRIMKKLGNCGYGNMFLACEKRRQNVQLLLWLYIYCDGDGIFELTP